MVAVSIAYRNDYIQLGESHKNGCCGFIHYSNYDESNIFDTIRVQLPVIQQYQYFECLTKTVLIGHVAPMAGGVADTEKYWFIFIGSMSKGFRPPWIPIYWVVGMLEKIRGFFIYKPIVVFIIFHSFSTPIKLFFFYYFPNLRKDILLTS